MFDDDSKIKTNAEESTEYSKKYKSQHVTPHCREPISINYKQFISIFLNSTVKVVEDGWIGREPGGTFM